jgi:sulfide:quinone oxidoreductase
LGRVIFILTHRTLAQSHKGGPTVPELAFLDVNVAVCSQLKPGDLADVAQRGFSAIVNNRPDGEAWIGQPSSKSLHAAAEAVGVRSHSIAFTLPSLTAEDARQLQTVIDEADGPVLVFCASGFRSALLWAIMRAAAGAPIDDLLKAAAAAGRPLDKHRDVIERLSDEVRTG